MMPDLDKFDGIGDLKVHLSMYVGALRPMEIQEELLAQLFRRILIGAFLHWFLNLELDKTRT